MEVQQLNGEGKYASVEKLAPVVITMNSKEQRALNMSNLTATAGNAEGDPERGGYYGLLNHVRQQAQSQLTDQKNNPIHLLEVKNTPFGI